MIRSVDIPCSAVATVSDLLPLWGRWPAAFSSGKVGARAAGPVGGLAWWLGRGRGRRRSWSGSCGDSCV